MGQRILVVEDEPAIAESIAYALKRDGFDAQIAGHVAAAQSAAAEANLIVLDLMLPDGSGFDLLQRWRAAGVGTPVIVLSSRDDEADRVAALEAGADDYVTKPFSPREVIARVRAVLRRSLPAGGASRVPPSAIALDTETRRAYVQGGEVELTRVEFDLLHAMLEKPGRVYSRAKLIDAVWGDGYALSDRTVDSHIKSLRRKLSEAGAPANAIDTVRGVGYRLLPEEPDATPS